MSSNAPHLIVGGDSVIGRKLWFYWNSCGISVCATTRRCTGETRAAPYVDLLAKEWSPLLETRYRSVIFCAGITKISECEDNPSTSMRVNVEGTLELARTLARQADVVLLLSTSQVFDGSKPQRRIDEPTCPVNEYGKQKVLAEEGILSLSNGAVLRLTKVVHEEWPLLRNWRTDLIGGRKISAFTNVTLAPITLDQVATCVDVIVSTHRPSINHLSGQSDISFFAFARELAVELGVDLNQVQESVCTDPRIPTFSSLAM